MSPITHFLVSSLIVFCVSMTIFGLFFWVLIKLKYGIFADKPTSAELFEKWADKQGYALTKEAEKGYTDEKTKAAWEGWQAALTPPSN